MLHSSLRISLCVLLSVLYGETNAQLQKCVTEFDTCSKDFLRDSAEKDGSGCLVVNRFFTCLENKMCGIGSGHTGNELLDASIGRMQEFQLSCKNLIGDDSVFDGVTEEESYGNFVKAIALFWKNGCYDVMSCVNDMIQDTSYSGDSDCGRFQASGHCMMKECRTMAGTDDEKMAAAALIAYYQGDFVKCRGITVGELINHGVGVLRRTVWETLSILLIPAILKVFLL